MKTSILGASGKMGRMIIAQALANKRIALVGGLAAKRTPEVGVDLGKLAGGDAIGAICSDDIAKVLAKADVAIDFSRPEVTLAALPIAIKNKTALVIGTTGFDEKGKKAIADAAKKIPIVQAANMSLGVNVLLHLVELGAKTFHENVDIEIVEMHHRHKVDAPSGTALALGEAAAKGRKVKLKEVACTERSGNIGARPQGEIGFATLRGGSVVGDHSVIFAGTGERVVLSHIAEDRRVFADGAITAALWVKGKKPGYYTMKDVLNLSN